jgi:hypothetical protein
MTQEQMKKTGWLLIIVGAAMMPVMLVLPMFSDYKFRIFSNYFWYIDFILFGTGYYLALKGRGYAPFKSRHFYGMTVFSLIPIIGPIVAIISLAYLPNFGEQLNPFRKKRAMLVSGAFAILIVIVMVLIGWQQFEQTKNYDLLMSADHHIRQADVLKKEGKDFSVEVALAQKDLQRIGRVFIGKYFEARIALISGDIFRMQDRYEEAEKRYKDAEKEMPEHVKERLARLNKLRKGP